MKKTISKRSVILLAAAALSPLGMAQSGDQDNDGIPDHLDPCPRSILSNEQLIPGCSSVDLMLYPEVVGDPVLASLQELEDVLAQRPELMQATEMLISARFRLQVGLEIIRGSQVEEGCATMFGGLEDLLGAQALLNQFILNLQQELDADFSGPPGGGPGTGGGPSGTGIGAGHQASRAGGVQNLLSPMPEYADCHPGGAELMYWQVRAEELTARTAEAHEMVNLFTILQSLSSGPFVITGEVAEIDDGGHRLLLTDGTEVVLPWIYTASDGFHLGQMIQINGDVYDEKPVAEDMVSTGSETEPWLDPFSEICLQFRFSPVTAFMTSLSTKHDPAGYLGTSGDYELEQGMAISAEEAGTCGPWPTGGPHNEVFGYLDSFEVKLSYTTKTWSSTTVVLASALTASSQPQFLPSDINPSVTATMTVVRNRQDYTSNDFFQFSALSAPYVVGTAVYPINVRDRGHFALYEYDKIAFAIDEDDPTDFELARVTGVDLALAANESTIDSGTFGVSASGYTHSNGLFQLSAGIGLNQDFAIRNHDFYPVWPSDGPPNSHWTGVTHPAGLEWPTIHGKRNGRDFRYTARLPEIVRDAVVLCGDAGGPTDAHCYYRLPFGSGSQTMVAQGNNGAFTHQGSQQFAYDFTGTEGTPLVASRSGIVNSVRSNITVNCQDQGFQGTCPFFGNFVSVVHQDGSEAFYLHMVTNSPVVVAGQEVRRGDVLGALGNTGNSTGPHVHFHVNGPGSTISIPARFELFQNPLMTFMQCVIPLQGWFVTSTN